MFTLILAAFYFILDIDGGEKWLKALLGLMFSCAQVLFLWSSKAWGC